MNERPYKDAVDRGVAWLDVAYPDWRDRVDPAKLWMENAFWCVLGLASGLNYYEALPHHGLSEDEALRLGFTAGRPAPTADFWALTEEWRLRLTTPAAEPPGACGAVPASIYVVRRAAGHFDLSRHWQSEADALKYAGLRPGEHIVEFPGSSFRVVEDPRPKLADLLAALAADPPTPVAVRGTRWGAGAAPASGEFAGQLVGLTAGDNPTTFSVKLKLSNGALADVLVEVQR